MIKASAASLKLREKSQILSASEIERTLVRLAHEIVEKSNGVTNLGLVGHHAPGGAAGAASGQNSGAASRKPKCRWGRSTSRFIVTICPPSAHRPEVKKSTMEFDIQDKDIVLVDDVLYTGRTARAALDALFDHGRPRRIQLCVLIDRGHRELPIEASFVGRTIQTTTNETIEVKLQEADGSDKVLLMERVARRKMKPQLGSLLSINQLTTEQIEAILAPGPAHESAASFAVAARQARGTAVLRSFHPHPHLV